MKNEISQITNSNILFMKPLNPNFRILNVQQGNIALRIINEKISRMQEFSVEELQKEITEAGGNLRISAEFSAGKYIMDLVEAKILEYDNLKSKFVVIDRRPNSNIFAQGLLNGKYQ